MKPLRQPWLGPGAAAGQLEYKSGLGNFSTLPHDSDISLLAFFFALCSHHEIFFKDLQICKFNSIYICWLEVLEIRKSN